MLSVCRRWALLALFMLMPLVIGACAGEYFSGLYGVPAGGEANANGASPAPVEKPLCYPAPAGAPAGAAPVCFHY